MATHVTCDRCYKPIGFVRMLVTFEIEPDSKQMVTRADVSHEGEYDLCAACSDIVRAEITGTAT